MKGSALKVFFVFQSSDLEVIICLDWSRTLSSVPRWDEKRKVTVGPTPHGEFFWKVVSPPVPLLGCETSTPGCDLL